MRILRCITLSLGSLGLVAAFAFAILCLEIDSYGRQDLAQPADVIVVLGAVVLPDGQPGPDLSIRTRHAVALYQAGLAPRLVCAGGVEGEPSSAAAVCKALARSLSVPEEDVFLADGSANTEEDAQRVAALMAEHGWQSAVVVSHPLHLYRAKMYFEREGLTAYTSPTTTDVDRISLPGRTYYAIREGAGIMWPYLEEAGFPAHWTATLQDWVYLGPWP